MMNDDSKPVLAKLQKAVELELATLPPYLTAMWSIKPGTNVEASVIIRSVFMEEMLHFTLAANLLSALGGTLRLGADEIPRYPLRLEFEGKGFREREIDIGLAPLSAAAIGTFMQIELPGSFVAANAPIKAAQLEVPGFTIGEFYAGIKDDLIALVEAKGEAAVFCGAPGRQIGEQFYWHGGGKPFAVTGLAEAKRAIDVICDQGEGADGGMFDGDRDYFGQPEEVAHYFKFRQIDAGRYYAATDSAHDAPSGAPLAVNYEDVFPVRPNCRHADFAADPQLTALSARFNANYSMMLSQLAEAFNGNQAVFYTAIMNGMRGLTPIAQTMMQIPIPGDAQGRTGCPTFEWSAPAL